MTFIGRMGETMARSINRRQALKRVSVAIFGTMSALAVRGPRGDSALAAYCTYITTGDCTCNPSEAGYCNRLDESYCQGARCSGGCEVDDTTSYVGGCWCSATCTYPGEGGGQIKGYYKCCDCNCGGTLCSCREFIEGTSETRGGPFIPGGSTGGGGSIFGEGGVFGSSTEQTSSRLPVPGSGSSDTTDSYADSYGDSYTDSYSDSYTDSYTESGTGSGGNGSGGNGSGGGFPSDFPFGN